jgi:hypothetical protein
MFVALSALACATTSKGAPFRSPSLDYQAPRPTTSDGMVVGADNDEPSDKLAEAATTQGAAPGWVVDEHGVFYDPKQRIGGAVDSRGHDHVERVHRASDKKKPTDSAK